MSLHFVVFNKMSSLTQREVTDKLIKEMAILMLSLDERDPAFGNEAAWDFIATELIGENDRKAVLYYIEGGQDLWSVWVLRVSRLAPMEPRNYCHCSVILSPIRGKN